MTRNGNMNMNVNGLVLTVLLATATAAVAQDSRGVALYKEGKFAEAANVLKTEVDTSPNDVSKLTYLGLARLQAGNAEAAIAPLDKAIGINAKYAEAHYGKGLVRAKLNQVDAAIASLETATTLAPNHAYAHYHLGMTYNKAGKKTSAIKHLRRFVELAPDAPEAPAVRSFLSRI